MKPIISVLLRNQTDNGEKTAWIPLPFNDNPFKGAVYCDRLGVKPKEVSNGSYKELS